MTSCLIGTGRQQRERNDLSGLRELELLYIDEKGLVWPGFAESKYQISILMPEGSKDQDGRSISTEDY
jgi:hypothetical protein